MIVRYQANPGAVIAFAKDFYLHAGDNSVDVDTWARLALRDNVQDALAKGTIVLLAAEELEPIEELEPTFDPESDESIAWGALATLLERLGVPADVHWSHLQSDGYRVDQVRELVYLVKRYALATPEGTSLSSSVRMQAGKLFGSWLKSDTRAGVRVACEAAINAINGVQP